MFVGLCASLFYRNDATWLRASVALSPDFNLWNVGLVFYSGLQGVTGVLVVQALFARRMSAVHLISRVTLAQRAFVFGAWIAVAGAFLLASSSLPVWAVIAIAAALSVVVGVASGLAHVSGLNWAPYVGGVLGALALVWILRAGGDPRVGLLAMNAIIGTVTLGALASAGAKR